MERVFRALSTEMRRRILRVLDGRWLCVGALSEHLGISVAAVSQHLRILRDAALVEAERHGTFIHYRAVPDAVHICEAAVSALFDHSQG